ncbi:hypothetical protein ACKA04_02465 [Helcococcus kunzii]|uniref:hypothetical protein n=1 Tax=Helcococcus kunzii TaxID=40091 RepID=UPI0038A67785
MTRRQQEILDRIKKREQSKYKVKFAENVYLEKSYPDSIEDLTIEYSTIDWRIGDGKRYILFTEEEIKSIDERYWDFRVEVN